MVDQDSMETAAIDKATRHPKSAKDRAIEAEINRIAKSMSRERLSKNTARYLQLRARLAQKCLQHAKLMSDDESAVGSSALHDKQLSNIDEMFLTTLEETLNRYDYKKGLFVHYFRFMYGVAQKNEFREAAQESNHFGGTVLRLDKPFGKDDGGTQTLGDTLGQEDSNLEIIEGDPEDLIVTRILSLIDSIQKRTDKEANDVRKLYTKLFFTETLTRITKVRTEGELDPLIRHERDLFKTTELPFQDSYTINKCRTILALWETSFIEGISELKPPSNFAEKKADRLPKNTWKLPATVFISYLEQIGYKASNALVSQQRKNYGELLKALKGE